MPTDVSAMGFSVLVKDSNLFPNGFDLTRFADDADPFDFPEIDLGEATMDANGYMVYAATPNPVTFALGLLPTTEEDKNMSLLMEAHRPAAGRARTGGDISVTVQYADGSSMTAQNVKLISGPPARSIAGPSRYKSKTYTFAAQDFTTSGM